MEDELVTVMVKPPAVDGLVVTDGDIPADMGVVSHGTAWNRYGLHPVDHVLEDEVLSEDRCYVQGNPRVRDRPADIEEEGCLVPHGDPREAGDLPHPAEVLFPVPAVMVKVVADTDVVGWRGDNGIHHPGSQGFEAVQAVDLVDTINFQPRFLCFFLSPDHLTPGFILPTIVFPAWLPL